MGRDGCVSASELRFHLLPGAASQSFKVSMDIDCDEWNLVRDEKRFYLITFPKLKLLCNGGLKERIRENLDIILFYEMDFSGIHF